MDIDLRAFGYEVIALEATEVANHVGEGDLVLLFEERHPLHAAIEESVRNARELVERDVVTFVGVEGYMESVRS